MSELVTLTDPRPGTVVELTPGAQLVLRFRRGLGPSRWHVAGRPDHVVLLGSGSGHELHFLVFGGTPGTVRLERRHPDRGVVHEVCEVRLEPLSDADGRPRAASRRTA